MIADLQGIFGPCGALHIFLSADGDLIRRCRFIISLHAPWPGSCSLWAPGRPVAPHSSASRSSAVGDVNCPWDPCRMPTFGQQSRSTPGSSFDEDTRQHGFLQVVASVVPPTLRVSDIPPCFFCQRLPIILPLNPLRRDPPYLTRGRTPLSSSPRLPSTVRFLDVICSSR